MGKFPMILLPVFAIAVAGHTPTEPEFSATSSEPGRILPDWTMARLRYDGCRIHAEFEPKDLSGRMCEQKGELTDIDNKTQSVLNFQLAGTEAPSLQSCPDGYSKYDRKCYKFSTDKMAFKAAKDACQRDGGMLATIDAQDTNDLVVKEMRAGGDSYWIGLNDVREEGSFVWSDEAKSPAVYTNWHPDQPDNGGGEDCVEMTKNQDWNDLPCSSKLNFICEKEKTQLTCPPLYGVNSFRGKCYRYSVRRVTFNEAKTICGTEGGRLAVLKDQATDVFIRKRIRSLPHRRVLNYWIGLSDDQEEGTFVWSDGTELTASGYTHWSQGKPDNAEVERGEDCVEIRQDMNYTWNDVDCGEKRRFVCEKGHEQLHTTPGPHDCAWLDQELQKQTQDIAELTAQLQQKEEEIKYLSTELQLREEDIQHLSTALQLGEEGIQDLSTRLQQKEGEIQDLSTRLQQKEEEIQDLSTRLQQKEEEIQDLSTGLQQKEGEIQDLSTGLEQKEEEIQDLSTGLQQKEEEIQQKEREIQQEEEIQDLSTRLQQKEEEVQALTTQLQQPSPGVEAVTPSEGHEQLHTTPGPHGCAWLDQELQEKDRELQEQTQDIAELTARLQQREWLIRRLRGEIKELSTRLEEKEVEIQHLYTELIPVMEGEIRELSARLQQKEGEIQDLSTRLQQKEEAVQALTTQPQQPSPGVEAVTPSEENCQLENGASYRGNVAVTKTGRTCQRWDSQTPHQHDRTPANFPSSGLEENYCRNPDGEPGVWCYTGDPGKRFELCAVPTCDRKLRDVS
ncbi:PREDICTED: uncharacterized protein LOC109479686 [Branchiostoma belcheri]|uniref:Uncharacterized protein LOC109479686 n=1 Tax=Branchiostoma belcheri TaxID=7741 RepID=A0A6P4Z756_BRABE|nr:PREDICTED: uncharacterized protein LOC109479686 [Branchiostoma belcheri]